MKNKTKSTFVTLGITLIIIAIVIISLIPKNKPEPTDSELIQCIGQKSTLYVQLGCTHCQEQEDLFGNNLKFIDKIDCFYEEEKCSKIEATPTWKINNDYIRGVQTIEQLKELTGC